MTESEDTKVYLVKPSRKIFIVGLVVVLLMAALTTMIVLLVKAKQPTGNLVTSKSRYAQFYNEVFDTIKTNYWKSLTDEELTNLFVLATEKVTAQPLPDKAKNRSEFESILENKIGEITELDKKAEFEANIVDIVLANLAPFGRSRLYSQKQEVDLKNRVDNVNPQVDLYQALGVDKTTKIKDVEIAYNQQLEKVTQDQTVKPGEKKEKIATLDKAITIFRDEASKKRYDTSGVEPTITARVIAGTVLHLHITKFSPTTVEELDQVAKKYVGKNGLDSLIVDLTDNVGGLIDGLPYFLGPFIGNNQYAYQFFQQGKNTDYKTKLGWLPSLEQYKKVVVLLNENTQSSAEVMASVLKKYNVGILMGRKSRGWGTVEKVFTLSNQISDSQKYSLFLVHSLTVREDGESIEGNGVDPVISLDDKGWENKLLKHFNYQPLIDAVGLVWREKTQK